MGKKNRIQEIREARGLSAIELAEKVNTSRGQIYQLEKSERRLTVDWMNRLARALKCRPQDLMVSAESCEVPVLGEVAGNGKISLLHNVSLIQHGLHEPRRKQANCEYVESPPGIHPSEVGAVRVKGDSLLPFMPSGTIVYYAAGAGEAPESCIDKLCVVQLKDGSLVLKTIKRGHGYGKYNLLSYDAAVTENAAIVWCAKVMFIKPA